MKHQQFRQPGQASVQVPGVSPSPGQASVQVPGVSPSPLKFNARALLTTEVIEVVPSAGDQIKSQIHTGNGENEKQSEIAPADSSNDEHNKREEKSENIESHCSGKLNLKTKRKRKKRAKPQISK